MPEVRHPHMDSQDLKYFTLLKFEIVKVLRQTFPAIPESMTDWMGTEITHFQEDLRIRQNEQLSQKWFYTHMKSQNDNLPRIDVLNFLSRYAGYTDWADFKYKNSPERPHSGPGRPPEQSFDRSARVFYLIPLLMIVILVLFILILKAFDINII